MEYMIKSIKHSGTKGERGTDRTDGRYPLRIGRTVDLYPDEIAVDYPMYIDYLTDSDGSDYSGKMIWTSRVVDISCNDDWSVIVVETDNSIFEFVLCEDPDWSDWYQ